MAKVNSKEYKKNMVLYQLGLVMELSSKNTYKAYRENVRLIVSNVLQLIERTM